MTGSTPPNSGTPPQGSQPLISQVEQVTAPFIEGVQAVGQDYILKTQTPPQQPPKK
jgi:hypothetical protein